jgi:hypothetical protein
MFDTHADLLSYSQIHSDVDQLFRAYLDTALMETAQHMLGNSKGYWKGVIELRKKKLGYPDPESDVKTDALSVADLIDHLPEPSDPSEASQYLYWFEVRADYWSQATQKELEAVAGALPASKRLEMLYEEARLLEGRIKTLSNGAEQPELGADESKALTWIDPLPPAAFQGLLAKVAKPARGSEK